MTPPIVSERPAFDALSPTKRPRRAAGVVPWVRLVRDATQEKYATEAGRIRAPRDVYAFLSPRLELEEVEVMVALMLNAQHGLIACCEISRGLVNCSLVQPREVFRMAIAVNASAVILAHNHPSGDPTPSADDCVITDQLVAAGAVIGIPVTDHIIIGRGRYTSFSESGLL